MFAFNDDRRGCKGKDVNTFAVDFFCVGVDFESVFEPALLFGYFAFSLSDFLHSYKVVGCQSYTVFADCDISHFDSCCCWLKQWLFTVRLSVHLSKPG